MRTKAISASGAVLFRTPRNCSQPIKCFIIRRTLKHSAQGGCNFEDFIQVTWLCWIAQRHQESYRRFRSGSAVRASFNEASARIALTRTRESLSLSIRFQQGIKRTLYLPSRRARALHLSAQQESGSVVRSFRSSSLPSLVSTGRVCLQRRPRMRGSSKRGTWRWSALRSRSLHEAPL